MIKYALACDQAHAFESWFPSSEAFDTQRKRGFVSCPICGSAQVEKQIMAPRLARTDRAPAESPGPPPGEAQPMALLAEKEREVRAMLRAIREHVERTSEPVGERFAEEARKMHYGEAEHRSIYGKADPHEAKALWEEGIEVHPIPILPDDRN